MTYRFIALREEPSLVQQASSWFHDKWNVPAEMYLSCMQDYLNHKTEYGWYLCLDDGKSLAVLA